MKNTFSAALLVFALGQAQTGDLETAQSEGEEAPGAAGLVLEFVLPGRKAA